VNTVVPGFKALGAELEPVMSYTDASCMRCGSCLQGCPTNAGKSTLNTYIHAPWAEHRLELRAGAEVRRVVIEDREATGVQYATADGELHTADAGVVVLAGGALATPGLLIRSGVRESAGHTPSSELIGRNLGFHAARLVEGLFDEIQDAHMVYPISAHCMKFQRDEDGGFLVEAATVQDPIGFASALCDEDGIPLSEERLVENLRRYRYFTGLLTMVNDENNGTAWVDESGRDRFSFHFNERERERIDASLTFAKDVSAASRRPRRRNQAATRTSSTSGSERPASRGITSSSACRSSACRSIRREGHPSARAIAPTSIPAKPGHGPLPPRSRASASMIA
jgi:ferredoxin